MIPSSTITGLVGELIFVITIPLIMVIILKMRTKVSLIPVFTGCIGFFVFALLIEGMLNSIVLREGTALEQAINGNAALYVAYIAISTALIEETGRLIICKLLPGTVKDKTSAIAFGLGHGGLEAIIIIILTVFINVAYASVVNEMGYNDFMASIADTDKTAIDELLTTIKNTTVLDCIMGVIERVGAVAVHISLALVVFYGVNKKMYIYYGLSVILHVIYNIPSTLVKYKQLSGSYIAQFATFLVAAGCVFLAYKLYNGFNNEKDPLFKKSINNTK